VTIEGTYTWEFQTLFELDEQELRILLDTGAVSPPGDRIPAKKVTALAYRQEGDIWESPSDWIDSFLLNAFFVEQRNARLELQSHHPLRAILNERQRPIRPDAKTQTLSWLDELDRMDRLWEEFRRLLKTLRCPEDIKEHLRTPLFTEEVFAFHAERLLNCKVVEGWEFESLVARLLEPFDAVDFGDLKTTGDFMGMIRCCSCGIPACISDYAWFEDYRCLLLLRVSAASIYEVDIFPEDFAAILKT